MARLEGIFFAEFDIKTGPKVAFESPKGLINSEAFDAISECVIPKPRLFGRMVSTYAFGKTYLSLPLCLEGSKYERNLLLFSVGFVIHPSRRTHSAEVAVYEPLVRKIAKTVEMLEIETGFLFDEGRKQKLDQVLEVILRGLKKDNAAVVRIDDANTLHLLMFPRQTSQPLPQTQEHSVPVPICDLRRSASDGSNFVVERILPYIDGIRFVKQIGEAANVDVELTIRSVQSLVRQNLVRLVDIFQFSNIYATTPKIGQFTKDKSLRDACLETVMVREIRTIRRETAAADVFCLYAALRPGLRFEEFCRRYDRRLIGIDKRKFVTFGLVNGLIRRVQPYPLYIPLPNDSTLSQLITDVKGSSQADSRLTTFELSLMDGKKSLDEVCCTVSRAPAEVARAVATHKRCILVYK